MLVTFGHDFKTFEQAVQAHKSGNLAQAEALYRQLLSANPNHPDALHMLGLLSHQLKRSQAAVELIEKSLTMAPRNAAAYSNLAEIKRSLGQIPAAEQLARQAIALDPSLSAAFVNLAMSLQAQGRQAESLPFALRAVELAPQEPLALSVAGAVLFEVGRLNESAICLEQAARLMPPDPSLLTSIGVYLERLDRLELAWTLQQRAAAMAPEDPRVLMNFGTILARIDRFSEAATVFRKVLEIQPNAMEAMEYLAGVLAHCGQHEECVITCKRVMELYPDLTGAHPTLGEGLMSLGRFDETIELMSKFAAARPRAAIYQSWSNALVRTGRLEEGMEILDRAVALEPLNRVLHFNKAIIFLMMGRLADAWPEYEWRWKHPRVVGRTRKYDSPLWDGSPLNGKRIILFAEQGLGDTIFFGRFTPWVAQRGGHIILRVQPSLRELAASLQGVSEVITDDDPNPPHDVHLPIMSLPGIFGTTLETIPHDVPYITTNPAKSAYWKAELARRTGKFKVGLVWEGGAFQPENFLRSASLAEYAPLGAVEGVAYFGLQKGTAEIQANTPPAGMDFTNLGPFMKDFSDTAAIIENLDLLISIDTSVVHIAGALAKPVWMMLAYTPGHMWMFNRSDSPWYPTFRVYRQPAFQDWPNTLKRVTEDLRQHLISLPK